MRIAIGGLHTECSTYSPLLQTRSDFRVTEGADLIANLGLSSKDYPGVEFIPLFHARSIPGGPVEPDCYQGFKEPFLRQLQAQGNLDGVLLIMHGALAVPGLDDPEGDWISAVRGLVGPSIPIAVSYDLHGNVTQSIVDNIDIFAAYRTAPHVDVHQTHERALSELVDMIRTGTRRMVAWAPVPVLLPGERTSTEDEPTSSIYRSLPSFDSRPGVTDANLMVGYVWADVNRATAAAVVTGTDATAIQEAASRIAQSYWDERANFAFGVPTECLNTCLDILEKTQIRPLVLADSGDNPTGGGVGDRADVLEAVLRRGIKGAVFAGICDPAAANAAHAAGVGACLSLSIGGALGSRCPVVSAEATVLAIHNDSVDQSLEVAVDISGNTILLTERRRPFHNISDIEKFDLNVNDIAALVVKSGYLSPELAPIANPALMALTDGAVNQDICSLQNRHRSAPNYPFQTDFTWSPEPKLSARGA